MADLICIEDLSPYRILRNEFVVHCIGCEQCQKAEKEMNPDLVCDTGNAIADRGVRVALICEMMGFRWREKRG